MWTFCIRHSGYKPQIRYGMHSLLMNVLFVNEAIKNRSITKEHIIYGSQYLYKRWTTLVVVHVFGDIPYTQRAGHTSVSEPLTWQPHPQAPPLPKIHIYSPPLQPHYSVHLFTSVWHAYRKMRLFYQRHELLKSLNDGSPFLKMRHVFQKLWNITDSVCADLRERCIF